MRNKITKTRKKSITILTIQLLLCLLLLPGCFAKKKGICSLTGSEFGEGTQIENGIEYRIGGFELTPGVYQICLQLYPEQNQGMSAEIYADTYSNKALLGNVVSIPSETDYFDFEVYVTDTIADAEIKLQINGANSPAASVELLEIYRTPVGNRMLLSLTVMVLIGLDALVIWRHRILEGKVTADQQLVVWGLIGTTLIAVMPYLADYFYGGADTFFHVIRIEALKESLQDGLSLPIRIQDYWLYGHGYAVSFFYGDFGLLFPALLRLLGFPMTFAYNAFMVAVTGLTYGIFYFSCYSCVRNRKAAVLGAVIYSLTAYRIFDLYSRGAMGEYLVMVFLPLVCAGMYLLYTGDTYAKEYSKYKWFLIIGLSAMLQTHLISTELAVICMAVICVVYWRKTFRRETFCQLAVSTVTVLLVNCWFWLPMLYMLYVDQYRLTAETTEYIQDRGAEFPDLLQFLPNKGGGGGLELQNGEPIQLGAAIALMALCYVIYLTRKKQKMTKQEKVFLLFAGVAMLFSMCYFPWDAVADLPVIGSISLSWQFPTRWMILAGLFGAMFAAFVCARWLENGGIWIKVATLIAAVAVGSALYQVNDFEQDATPVYLYTAENLGNVSVINGEYLFVGGDLIDYYAHLPVAEDGLTYTDYEKQGLEIQISLSNTTDQELTLELPLNGYKGYAVEQTDGTEGEVEVRIADEHGSHGDLKLIVPAGYEGTIRVWYRGFTLFRVAEWISLISVLAIIGTEVVRWKRKR